MHRTQNIGNWYSSTVGLILVKYCNTEKMLSFIIEYRVLYSHQSIVNRSYHSYSILKDSWHLFSWSWRSLVFRILGTLPGRTLGPWVLGTVVFRVQSSQFRQMRGRSLADRSQIAESFCEDLRRKCTGPVAFKKKDTLHSTPNETASKLEFETAGLFSSSSSSF